MEKIAILVDSGSDLSLDYIGKEGFYYLPLYVNLDGKFLKDRIDISPEDFYEWIKTNNKLPKTSMPSPGDINELLEKIRDDGYDRVICINIGSKFSGTYNACKLAEVEGIEVYAFNTGNLTLAQGFFATYAKKLIDDGFAFEEITKKLEEKNRRFQGIFYNCYFQIHSRRWQGTKDFWQDWRCFVCKANY